MCNCYGILAETSGFARVKLGKLFDKINKNAISYKYGDHNNETLCIGVRRTIRKKWRNFDTIIEKYINFINEHAELFCHI